MVVTGEHDDAGASRTTDNHGSGGGGPSVDGVRAVSTRLFARLRSGPDVGERRRVRDELVQLHLPIVEHAARRFANRGESMEDLVQIGTIGLIKAVDRFDASRGWEFSTYATPTVIGEIKRWFRDRGWAVRVPRRLQDLRTALARTTSELTQRLGRPPTSRELAEELGIDVEEVLEGLESVNAYAAVSLDQTLESAAPNEPVELHMDDRRLERVEVRASVRPLLKALPSREQRLLTLRFFHGMSQSQIAAEIGVSQMQVSRLLARTLDSLREDLLEDLSEDGDRTDDR